MNLLANILPKILPVLKFEPSAEQNGYDYSSSVDFKKLWGFTGLPGDRIVIVWSRTAPDPDLAPINAADCLSPLDWAAAYVKHLAVEPVNWPEILILDAAPKAHVTVPTLAHFHTLRQDQLPWLTVPACPGLKDILEWFAKPKPPTESPEAYKKDCIAALDRFLREIRLNLTSTDEAKSDFNHHAISNIVAPMVLLGKPANTSFHSNALLKLLQASGLCGDVELEEIALQMDVGKDISILLVDDQAEHGWKDWIKNSLKPAKFEYRTNPYDLLDTLEDQFAKADKLAQDKNRGTKAKDLRFSFRLPGLEDGANPVLFLDLRLFSGNPEAERAFYKRLLTLIEDRFLSDDLAWMPFDLDDDAFKNAKLALGHSPDLPHKADSASFTLESTEHHEALTWLPRILSLVDMSMPIVLFSSTGRRDLVEPFRHYGNIITNFEKPRLTNISQNLFKDTYTQLADALTQCNRMHRVRQKARFVLNLKADCCTNLPATSAPHIELYLDEKFDSSWNGVGGVFAVFDSESAARQFEDVLILSGLNYFDRGGLDPQFHGAPHSKEKDILPILEQAISTWRSQGRFVRIGVASLEDSTDETGVASDLTNPAVADNRYRVLLGALVEHFVCESVPAILGTSAGSASVYCGTRLVYIGNPAERSSCIRRFGLKVTPFDESLLYSFGEDDLAQITAEALRHHPDGPWDEVKIDRCLAISIPYFKRNANTTPVNYTAPNRPTPHPRVLAGFSCVRDALCAVEVSWLKNYAVTYHDARSRTTKCWAPKAGKTLDATDFPPGGVVGKDENGELFLVAENDWRNTNISAWRPDVPLLLYAADCILREGAMDRCPSIEKIGLGVLDDVLDSCFEHTQNSGRARDRGHFGEALRLLPNGSTCEGYLRHCVVNVATGLTPLMDCITGNDFVRCAMDVEKSTYRSIRPRQALIATETADLRAGTEQVRFFVLKVKPTLKEKIHGVVLSRLHREDFSNLWVSNPVITDDKKSSGMFVVKFVAEFTKQDSKRLLNLYGRGGEKGLFVKGAVVIVQ